MLLTTIPTFEYVFSANTSYSPELYPDNQTLPDGSIKVSVYPDWYEDVVIEWTIPAEWGDCTFEVFQSDSEQGPFTDLTAGPIRDKSFTDSNVETNSKFSTTFYIVKVNKPDGITQTSNPVTWGNQRSDWVSLRAKEIKRRELILLRKFVGVKSFVFKRMNFGKRCPNCWDERSRVITKPDCKVCYGTGFEGGYFNPIPCLFQYNPVVRNANMTYAGKVESNRLTAWTVDYPQLNYLDLVYRIPDSRMFWNRGTEPTELQTVTVRQTSSLEELSKSSIEYELLERPDVQQILKSYR